MSLIFEKLAEMVKQKTIKQREIAEKLGIDQSHVSGLLRGSNKPSKTLTILAEMVFGERREKHKDKTIAAIEEMLEDMDKESRERVFRNVQDTKFAQELIKRKAA
ncbi:helix-turn-helix transcriptional regulator [Geobacter sp. SVR]|uniref:helix-turn-helix domain-containing protein n=1 Tax=Geobacter sp. SVR TaxID=2495594 RepID=UPI00143EFC0E|nr:helix-turn-helix transcriptional regulator [Geobacter sp. SVR]BCS53916.1 hypothetical protein GSVR_22240 [Geobacter sp. SVR]GCF86304.1 hypothetical protein GSbR_29040 [Geobacter sp. SVR]